MYTSRYRGPKPSVDGRNQPPRPAAVRPSISGIASAYNPGTPRRNLRFPNPRFPSPPAGTSGLSKAPVFNPTAYRQPTSAPRPQPPVRNYRFPNLNTPAIPRHEPQPASHSPVAGIPRIRPFLRDRRNAAQPDPVPDRDEKFVGPPQFPIDTSRFDINQPFFLASEALRQMSTYNRVPWRCLRATRFAGTDKNFEELLAHFGIEKPFINPDKANKLLNYAEHVWVRKAPDNYLKEDMIFETQERFDDWIGIETYGEAEYFRRKASIKRQQRNTDAEIEKREEQRQRKLLRKEREEAEMRRLEKMREEERMKEEERRMNRFTVRSSSSGYNRGSSYRTPPSTRSRTSSQVARLEDPLPNCGTWYFRPDFSLIGSPVERNRYGRLLPMKQKLLITLMFNPFGIQMRNLREFYDQFWNENLPLGTTSPSEPNEKLLSFLQTYYHSYQIALFDAKDLRNVHGDDEFASDRLKVGLELHRQMCVEHISCDHAGYSHEELISKKKEITDKNKAIRDVLVLLDQCVEAFKSGFYVDDLDLMMQTIFRWDIVKTTVLGLGITCASVCKSILSLRRHESHSTHGDIVSVLSNRRLEGPDRYSDENRHPMLVRYLSFFEEIDADSIHSAFEVAAKKGIVIVPENEIGAIYFRYTKGVLRATTAQVMQFIRENMYNVLGEMEYVFPTSNPSLESSNGVYLFENEEFIHLIKNKRYPEVKDKMKEGQRVHIGTFTHFERNKVMLILAENFELRENLDSTIRERVMKGDFKVCDRREILPGMPVIACFEEKYWSRAKIRGWSKKIPQNVEVLFVDYGQVLDLPRELILEIEDDEMAEPPLALCYNIGPYEGSYDDKAVTWLHNLTDDRPDLIIKKISARGREDVVDLLHCDTNYDITKIMLDYARQCADRRASNTNPPAELPSLHGTLAEGKMSLNNPSEVREVISLGSECSIYTIKCSSPEFKTEYQIELSYVRSHRGVFISNHMLIMYKLSCSQEYQKIFDDIGVVSCDDCCFFTQTKLPYSPKPHEQEQIEAALLHECNSHAFLLSIDELLDEAKRIKKKHFLAVLKEIEQQGFIQKMAEKDPYDVDGLDLNGNNNGELPIPDYWIE